MNLSQIVVFLVTTNLITAQDCQPYGLRVSLGHFFTNLSLNTDALRLVFNSQDKCENQFTLKLNGNEYTTPNTLFLNMTDIYKGAGISNMKLTFIHLKFLFQTQKSIVILQYTIIIYIFRILSHYHHQINSKQKFGDMDSSWIQNRSKPTFDWLQNQVLNQSQFDSILFTGDMAYDLESENCLRGQFWLKNISTFTKKYPFMVVPGEHHGGFNSKQIFLKAHFQMPYLSESNEIYRFDIGSVHFIQYDPGMIVYKADPDDQIKIRMLSQYRQDLEEFNNEMFNGLLYSLIIQIHVDLYVAGHQNNYQRNKPYFQNSSVSFTEEDNQISDYESPVSIIEGASGEADYEVEMTIYADKLYTVKQLDKNGVELMQVLNQTHLLYQHIQVPTNEVMDEFWIIHNIQNDDENHGIGIGGIIGIVGGSLFFSFIFILGCIYGNQNKKYTKIQKGRFRNIKFQN